MKSDAALIEELIKEWQGATIKDFLELKADLHAIEQAVREQGAIPNKKAADKTGLAGVESYSALREWVSRSDVPAIPWYGNVG